MKMLHRCERYLQEHGVGYTHSIGGPDGEDATLTKAMVYIGDHGPGMLVLPDGYSADLVEISRLLRLGHIRLASEAELAGLFPECEPEAMPPFGNFFDLPVLLDEKIAIAAFLVFRAGTAHDFIRMRVADFDRLVDPLVAIFAIRIPSW